MGISNSSKPSVEKMENEKDVDGLIKALKDERGNVRREAAIALGRIGDARAVEPLIQVLKDQYDYVRREAAYALGIIGDARAVKPLIQALGDEDSFVRSDAAEALAKVGKPAVEPLTKALKDGDSRVRDGAKEALGKIMPPAPPPPSAPVRQPVVSPGLRPGEPERSKGLETKSLLCDLCGKPTPENEIFRVPLGDIQRAVREGFNPYKTDGIEMPLASLASTFGLDTQSQFLSWRNMVMRDTTDWGLCSSCAKAFSKATGWTPAPPPPPPPHETVPSGQPSVESRTEGRGVKAEGLKEIIVIKQGPPVDQQYVIEVLRTLHPELAGMNLTVHVRTSGNFAPDDLYVITTLRLAKGKDFDIAGKTIFQQYRDKQSNQGYLVFVYE